MAAGDSSRLQEAQKLAKTDPRKAEAIYKDMTSKAPQATSEAATREYESALISLGQLYRDERSALPAAGTETQGKLTRRTESRKSWSIWCARAAPSSRRLQRQSHPSSVGTRDVARFHVLG